jgi:hypothetical protein
MGGWAAVVAACGGEDMAAAAVGGDMGIAPPLVRPIMFCNREGFKEERMSLRLGVGAAAAAARGGWDVVGAPAVVTAPAEGQPAGLKSVVVSSLLLFKSIWGMARGGGGACSDLGTGSGSKGSLGSRLSK